jgi:hypothetical protein
LDEGRLQVSDALEVCVEERSHGAENGDRIGGEAGPKELWL